MKQSRERIPGDELQKDLHKAQIGAFLSEAEDRMHEEKLKDVYVTDHVPKTKQLLTTNEEEDAQYYAYMKSLSDYKKKVGHTKRYLNHLESGKYARGSMLQRVFEPLAGSIKQDNGTIFLEILDKDVTLDTDESKARQRYELLKNDEASDVESNSEDARVVAVREKDLEGYIDADALRAKMENEFQSFLKGEKYDVVSDLRNSFAADLSTPLSTKIIREMPDYVFYDIKTPRAAAEESHNNPWNPQR
jgi:predicted transcriptional regulator